MLWSIVYFVCLLYVSFDLDETLIQACLESKIVTRGIREKKTLHVSIWRTVVFYYVFFTYIALSDFYQCFSIKTLLFAVCYTSAYSKLVVGKYSSPAYASHFVLSLVTDNW